VAVGPRAGEKVFSLQTVPAREEPRKGAARTTEHEPVDDQLKRCEEGAPTASLLGAVASKEC